MAVMLLHYTTRIGELFEMGAEPLFSPRHGHFGVNLFFIISGYVVPTRACCTAMSRRSPAANRSAAN